MTARATGRSRGASGRAARPPRPLSLRRRLARRRLAPPRRPRPRGPLRRGRPAGGSLRLARAGRAARDGPALGRAGSGPAARVRPALRRAGFGASTGTAATHHLAGPGAISLSGAARRTAGGGPGTRIGASLCLSGCRCVRRHGRPRIPLGRLVRARQAGLVLMPGLSVEVLYLLGRLGGPLASTVREAQVAFDCSLDHFAQRWHSSSPLDSHPRADDDASLDRLVDHRGSVVRCWLLPTPNSTSFYRAPLGILAHPVSPPPPAARRAIAPCIARLACSLAIGSLQPGEAAAPAARATGGGAAAARRRPPIRAPGQDDPGARPGRPPAVRRSRAADGDTCHRAEAPRPGSYRPGTSPESDRRWWPAAARRA